jgi:hypothetical protein
VGAVLISWVHPNQTDQSLGGAVLGLGGSTVVLEQGNWVYVTGQVTLDADSVGAPAGWLVPHAGSLNMAARRGTTKFARMRSRA